MFKPSIFCIHNKFVSFFHFLSQNEIDPSKFAFHPRSPSSFASSDRVRSRLVRSALRDNGVVVETVRTYEMITEFKMNIIVWLQEHGLGHKCKLLASIPDITLNKVGESLRNLYTVYIAC